MMNNMYNHEIKERFLATFDNEGTQTTLRNLFQKSYLIENTLDTDLINFNQEQIGKVIANSSPLNAQVSRTIGNYISLYLNWGIEEGYREGSNINPLKGVPTSWYGQFIDKKKIHFSKDEFFNDIVENLDNSQDQLLLSLLWFGISGEKFIELREMHYNHIHWNENKIDVYDESGYNRTVQFEGEDIRVMRYLENAYKDDIYRIFKEDGEYSEKEILRSDYIFRNIKSARASQGEPITFNVFYTRLKAIRENFELEYLTPNSISQSAQLFHVVQLYLRDGEFGMKQRNELGEKFNLPKVINQSGLEYYNTQLMAFINPEAIKELYNIDIKM
jgi:hypothetical protein